MKPSNDLGKPPIERISIKAWLEEWFAGKQAISERTRENYTRAVREFLAFLGPEGSNRRLESITERDILGFVAHLRKVGRAPGTIKSIVRQQLATAFGKAKKLGKIPYNPVLATDSEIAPAAVRDTFTPQQVAKLVAVASRDWQGRLVRVHHRAATRRCRQSALVFARSPIRRRNLSRA
jgi:site-specific recombinase XerD